MFNEKKLNELERRIIELEYKPIEKDYGLVDIITAHTATDGKKSWLMGVGEVTEVKPRAMTMSINTRHRVSINYVLQKILDHLKLELIFNEGKSPEIELIKKKPAKKK